MPKIIIPPIQTNVMSSVVTANMSPNNKPIKSKRIEERKPIKTKPIARVECARRPSRESPANFVLFCKLIKSIATIDEIKKTDKVILILNAYARVTPSKAECDNVSPKYDKRLHITTVSYTHLTLPTILLV